MKKRINKNLPDLDGVLIKKGEVYFGFWKFIKEACQEFIITTYYPDHKSCFRAIRIYKKTRSLDIPESQSKTLKQCLAGN